MSQAARGAGRLIKQLVRLSLLELAGGTPPLPDSSAGPADRIRLRLTPPAGPAAVARPHCGRHELQQAPPVPTPLATTPGFAIPFFACAWRPPSRPAPGPQDPAILRHRPVLGLQQSVALQPDVPREHTGASPSEFRNTYRRDQAIRALKTRCDVGLRFPETPAMHPLPERSRQRRRMGAARDPPPPYRLVAL